MPDEPYRAKGAGSEVGLHPTLHIRRCPHLLVIPRRCAVCLAYQAHSTHLLQPRTSASAYSIGRSAQYRVVPYMLEDYGFTVTKVPRNPSGNREV